MGGAEGPGADAAPPAGGSPPAAPRPADADAVAAAAAAARDEFYVRYYVGRRGRHGHEFLEIELRSDGRLRYANQSRYGGEARIRKVGCALGTAPARDARVRAPSAARSDGLPCARHRPAAQECVLSQACVREVRRLVTESGIVQEDDARWPEPGGEDGGRQELEVVLGAEHVSFVTAETESLSSAHASRDPRGLERLYYCVQDLKAIVLGLMSLHFKERPV